MQISPKEEDGLVCAERESTECVFLRRENGERRGGKRNKN